MNPQELLTPLMRQLEDLTQVVHESPYITRDTRLGIEREITALTGQLQEGEILYPEGEKSLIHLNKRVAIDEISNLSSKIRQLNPTSPRLEILHSLENELHSDKISAEQARKKIQELMGTSTP